MTLKSTVKQLSSLRAARYLRRAIGWLIIACLLLIMTGVLFETLAERRVDAQYPAPGTRIDLENRQMHIDCRGSGSPTVILDAGMGGWSSDWRHIATSLSQTQRVCAYDRAGYGWSDPAEDDRSPAAAAADLELLLERSGEAPPYVLVANSRAGLSARIFAAHNRAQLAGLILVDPATESDNALFGEALLAQQRSAVPMLQVLTFLARTGVVRLLGPENLAPNMPFLAVEPADRQIYYTFVADPLWWETLLQEFRSNLNERHLQTVADAWSQHQSELRTLPLVIIGSDTLGVADTATVENIQRARHRLLAELAAGSEDGRFVVANGSTHNILADRPDVVLDAIRSVPASPAAR